jgi:hypothetical protein
MALILIPNHPEKRVTRTRCLRNRFPLIALCLALLCSGCILVPVRVPTKTRTASAELKRKADVSFIQVGVTTRDEVQQNLGWIDTGLDGPLFLGRWAQSSWGVVWGVGGYAGAAAGWQRGWTLHNLLIDFDDQGVVRQISTFPGQEILEVLASRFPPDAGHPAEPGKPVDVPVEYLRGGQKYSGTLSVGGETLAFHGDPQARAGQAFDFHTPAANVIRLSPGQAASSTPGHLEKLALTIHFREKTTVGRKFNMRVDMHGAVELVRCFPPDRKEH